MDWIKIKPSHILFSDLSDKELLALIRIQCLTAHLEASPSEKQIHQQVHYKTLKSLQGRLKEGSIDLQGILKKVLTDVQEVVDERKRWRDKKRKQRGLERIVPQDVLVESPVREDKLDKKDKNILSSKYLSKPDIEKLCEQKLGKMATKKEIMNVLEQVPEKMRWMVDTFLKKRYPASPSAFEVASAEMRKLTEKVG